MTIETDNTDFRVKVVYVEVKSKFRIGYLNHIFSPCSSESWDSSGTACNGRALWMSLKDDIEDTQ